MTDSELTDGAWTDIRDDKNSDLDNTKFSHSLKNKNNRLFLGENVMTRGL